MSTDTSDFRLAQTQLSQCLVESPPTREGLELRVARALVAASKPAITLDEAITLASAAVDVVVGNV